jgi:hypothetical protein
VYVVCRLLINVKVSAHKTARLTARRGDNPLQLAQSLGRVYALDNNSVSVLTSVVEAAMMQHGLLVPDNAAATGTTAAESLGTSDNSNEREVAHDDRVNDGRGGPNMSVVRRRSSASRSPSFPQPQHLRRRSFLKDEVFIDSPRLVSFHGDADHADVHSFPMRGNELGMDVEEDDGEGDVAGEDAEGYYDEEGNLHDIEEGEDDDYSDHGHHHHSDTTSNRARSGEVDGVYDQYRSDDDEDDDDHEDEEQNHSGDDDNDSEHYRNHYSDHSSMSDDSHEYNIYGTGHAPRVGRKKTSILAALL